MNYCKGCGVEISSNIGDLGYSPKSEAELCKRCFDLKNKGIKTPRRINDEFYQAELKKLVKNKYLYVFVLDVINYKDNNINWFLNLIKGQDYIIAVNRIDILPKIKKYQKIKEFLRRKIKEAGHEPISILPVSALKKAGVDDLVGLLKMKRKGKDVVFVGSSNLGKTSLINAVINSAGAKKQLLAFNLPGTTIKAMPYDFQGFKVYDTPGLIDKDSITNYVELEDLKYLEIKHEIKQKTFLLNPGQTMYLGGIAKFRTREDSIKAGYGFYFSRELKIHRTNSINEEKIDENLLINKLLPIEKGKRKTHTFKINDDNKKAIYIPGAGVIAFKGKGISIDLEINENVSVYMDESIF